MTITNRRRKGAILFLVCASLLLFVAMAALAIDLGWVYLQEGKLQKGANTAAIAAANRCYSGGTVEQTRQSAKNLAGMAGISLEDADIQLNPLGNNRKLIRIWKSMPVSLFFGPILGSASISVGYDVYALANRDATLAYSAPLTPLAASGIVPLYVPHADLYPILRGVISTKAELAELIFGPNRAFRVGQRYLLKTGQSFKVKLQDLINMGSSQQGALVLPGQGYGAQSWQDEFQNGHSGMIRVGDILDTEPGTMQGPVQTATMFRYNQDPIAVFGDSTRPELPLSARMIVVPIANAFVSGPSDAGTGVENLKNIGEIWDGRIAVQVIGLAKFFLDAYSTAEGQGVITGVFAGYVGTPPSGQDPG